MCRRVFPTCSVNAPNLQTLNTNRGMMGLLGPSTGTYVVNQNGLHCGEKWYDHKPESVMENEDLKVLWDFTVQTD